MIEEIPLKTQAEDEDLRTYQMVTNVDTIKNQLVEDMPLPAFEDQTLDKTDVEIADEEPNIREYVYPFSLYRHKNKAINK